VGPDPCRTGRDRRAGLGVDVRDRRRLPGARGVRDRRRRAGRGPAARALRACTPLRRAAAVLPRRALRRDRPRWTRDDGHVRDPRRVARRERLRLRRARARHGQTRLPARLQPLHARLDGRSPAARSVAARRLRGLPGGARAEPVVRARPRRPGDWRGAVPLPLAGVRDRRGRPRAPARDQDPPRLPRRHAGRDAAARLLVRLARRGGRGRHGQRSPGVGRGVADGRHLALLRAAVRRVRRGALRARRVPQAAPRDDRAVGPLRRLVLGAGGRDVRPARDEHASPGRLRVRRQGDVQRDAQRAPGHRRARPPAADRPGAGRLHAGLHAGAGARDADVRRRHPDRLHDRLHDQPDGGRRRLLRGALGAGAGPRDVRHAADAAGRHRALPQRGRREDAARPHLHDRDAAGQRPARPARARPRRGGRTGTARRDAAPGRAPAAARLRHPATGARGAAGRAPWPGLDLVWGPGGCGCFAF